MLLRSWSRVRRAAAIALLVTLAWSSGVGAQTLGLQLVASGLANPVALTGAGDGSNRLFIVDQTGIIRILSGGQVLATPFLNITTKVLSGGERGLLGLAFDAGYTSNGFFYVFYTSQPAGEVTIARYSVTTDPNVANPSSELVLKTQTHSSFSNHNGGALAFGPDACLYAGIGDGGGGGDPDNNGQNLGTLLGKIIRISPTDGTPCAAAPGNPFVGTQGARGEIWALGVRNPWRITFDRQTGDLLIADVGQGAREEVNFQPAGSAGRNYCWKRKEGTQIFDANVPCTAGTPTDPILEYAHTGGNCSITGGYRYRGSAVAAFAGVYFYGDFCSGRIWGASESGGAWTTAELLDTPLNISTFGEDDTGEVYVVHLSATAGAVYRLVAGGPPALQVSPATGAGASGLQGGPFSPSPFSYSLNSSSTSVGYSVAMTFDPGVPSWLTASSASGMVTTAPAVVTFTVNAAANNLSPGTYAAVITFTNTTNGQGTQARTVTLGVNAPGAPANDHFANAATIHLGQTSTGSNANATRQSGEPVHAGNAGGRSVWWNFLAPSSVPVRVSTAGSSFDTLLGVYTGGAVAALTLVAANDDSGGVTSEVSFNASGGTVYRIAVDGKSGGSGSIQLAVLDNSPPGATAIVAAVAPTSRGTFVNHAITAYVSIINSGGVAATACSIALPAGLPATFTYQTVDSNNVPTGTPNTPVNIPAGATQGFYFILTPTATMAPTAVAMVFDCTNTNPAPVFPGVNTFVLTVNAVQGADVLIATATAPDFQIMDMASPNATSAFSAAAINIGTNAMLTFAPTDTAIGQLPSGLPLTLLICQINPANGQCINPASPGASSTVTLNTNQIAYFGVFAVGQGTFIPFDIPNNRVFVRSAQAGAPVAEGGVAVRMLSGGPAPPPASGMRSPSAARW